MNNLVWFGNNLRVADNLSLQKACSGSRVIGVFCFDPRWQERGDFGFKNMGVYRAQFLIETVRDLQESLASLNISLLVFHDKPESVIPKLVEEHGIDCIFLQNEWTRNELRVLDGVKSQVNERVKWETAYDQFLYHPEDIPFRKFAEIPEVFTHFRKLCEKHAAIRPPLPVVKAMPSSNVLRTSATIPTIEDLGYRQPPADGRTAFPFRGGEKAAIKRIGNYFWESGNLARYKHTRNGLIGKDYSSKLSAWLANGSLSARTLYREVRNFENDIVRNQDTYWLIFELIWRDYFKYISLKHGSAIFLPGGIRARETAWKFNQSCLDQWISATSCEPFVNANMKEIARTGWMSNRGRQNVASFWARDLGQDWRVGAAYFESVLIDYDVHSNWGNWMYVAGVGNDPRDRKFHVQKQAEHYDPDGDYQRLWLQESLYGPGNIPLEK